MTSLYVFDLDGTLLTKNISYEFAIFLFRRKYLSLSKILYAVFILLLKKVHFLSFDRFYNLLFKKMLKGFSLDFLEKESSIFCQQFHNTFLYHPVWNLLLKCVKEKQDYIVLTASPHFLIAKFLSLHKIQSYQGSMLHTDQMGIIRGIDLLMNGENKKKWIIQLSSNKKIKKKDVWFYSDSIDDRPCFVFVGHPIVVRPSFRLLIVSFFKKWTSI